MAMQSTPQRNHTTASDMPEVTDAHRHAAFEAMRWPGWTYEAAMAYDLRRRLIEARAHHIRTQQYVATQRRTVVPVRRCRPGADGHPVKWCTQLVMGPHEAIEQPELI